LAAWKKLGSAESLRIRSETPCAKEGGKGGEGDARTPTAAVLA